MKVRRGVVVEVAQNSPQAAETAKNCQAQFVISHQSNQTGGVSDPDRGPRSCQIAPRVRAQDRWQTAVIVVVAACS